MAADDYYTTRQQMVSGQLERRGISDERVLDAMRSVPRHKFVPQANRNFAYDDRPLPIGEDQTISQPYIVALMTEMLCLRKGDRVLEVGTGSGYQAAILAELADQVFSIERNGVLGERAAGLLEDLGYNNVQVHIGDGTCGLPEAAPFDAICVAAAGPQIPDSLKDQLSVGGRLVCPTGSRVSQTLTRLTKIRGNKIKQETGIACAFVPLIGEEGWPERFA